MAKRKTRQQKIIADLRRQLSTTKTEPIKIEELPKSKLTTAVIPQEKKINSVINNAINDTKHLAYTNPYLSKDLRKTAILTTGIVLGQVVLFFLFRQHILILPGISY
jgi:hypothetical protein